MIATYDVRLVVLSSVIAVIASYTALDLAGRVTAATGRVRKLWLAGGAIAMGTGIGSMHFIAMLAYNLPIPIDYNSEIVFASLAVAVVTSGLALDIVSRQQVDRLQFLAGGSFMGLAIATMHYTGMAAMQLEARVEYDFALVALSVVIAIGASFAALWLTFVLRSETTATGTWRKIGSALIMGTAIAGMHYTAMAAVCFASTNQALVGQVHSIDNSMLALTVGIATLVILALALQAAFVARRISVEVALAESQRKLATLIDSLPGIVFSCGNDCGWSMTYLSEGCLNLTGYQSEELVGTEGVYKAITHPEDLPKVLQAIDAAIALEQPYVAEYRIRTKSGQEKWLWEKGSAVFDTKGEVLGFEGFITDITERKHSEEALRESEHRYRELFESHPHPMWVYDLETLCFLAVNNAAVHHYGYARDEFLSMTIRDIRPPEDVPTLLENVSKVTSGFDKAGTWRHRKKDGTVINVEITSHTLTFAGKRAEVVSANDVTLRQQTEEALRQAEAKYRSIFENAIEGIFQTTPDGHYISANPALARIYGYESPEELIASLCNIEQQLYAEPNRRAEFIRLMQEHDAVSGFESQVYRQDGSAIWISENARAVRDASGVLLCYEGSVEDITERKQTEEAQARFTTILEATTDFVGIADVHGHPFYLNKAGRKMVGLDNNEDISNKKISDFHPDWANVIILNEGIPTALSGNVWMGETALLNCNGQEIPVSQVLLAHKTPEGKVEFLATVIRDISERKRFEVQLAYLANHDPLTGLFNRRHFREQLEHHLALAQRYNDCGALLFVDLDDFKDINDILGHGAGDELLKNFAILLQERVRKTDILARLGGDEFAILLPQTSLNGVQLLAQQILEALQHHVVVANGQPVRITASIGATLFPDHGMIADELLAHADLAMYKSKQSGRNCLSLYTPDRDWRVQVESRNIWKNRIREALEQDQFVLYCQPILDLRSNQTSSYELLLRMVGKEGELITPNTFLPIAESSGLICNIDRWVVRRAIHLIAAHAGVGRDLQLEVNLSGKSLSDNELLPMIQQELAKTCINPASLVMEITETVAIADISQARKFINTLKQLGCKFALDDFGMGYSSFSQLKHLPVDYLKIDGSFIKNLLGDPVDRHLVKAIVEVAHGLAKSTIAEFVRDEETVQLLRHLGVDYAQGYYIGQPRAVAELSQDFVNKPSAQVERSSCGILLFK